MDDIIYNAISKYFSVLEKTGYYPYSDVYKVLVLIFYHDLVYNDTQARISFSDYQRIDRVLNCMFGTNCLMPYPNYQKMGTLHTNSISELKDRIDAIECTYDEIGEKYNQLKDTNVVMTKDSYIEEIDDIKVKE